MNNNYYDLQDKLKIDCVKCSGLCCVALYCTKTDGFPSNKESGVPCKHLMSNFRCDMHSQLSKKNMRGCLAYDCFGAGQKVTQYHFPNLDWKKDKANAKKVFNVFQIIFQLHQMEWYLLEALPLITDKQLKIDVELLICKNEQITKLPSDDIMKFDIESYRLDVNKALKQLISTITLSSDKGIIKDFIGHNFKKQNLNKKDFSIALLIAANLEGCNLQGTCFLGADIRDMNIRNTDLSLSIFLTQMQINSAQGNDNTKLPRNLSRPIHWQSNQY